MTTVEISEQGVNGLANDDFERLVTLVHDRSNRATDAELLDLVRRSLAADEDLQEELREEYGGANQSRSSSE